MTQFVYTAETSWRADVVIYDVHWLQLQYSTHGMPVQGSHLSCLGWRRKGGICGSGGDGGGSGDHRRLWRRGGGCGGGGDGCIGFRYVFISWGNVDLTLW